MLEKEELELDQEIVLKDLRQKTLEVGEISMKIDEYQMRNHDIAGHIRRIENFDKDLFERVKKTASQQELL